MRDRIEVEITFGGPVHKKSKKTYMLSEISLQMLLECNEFIWPDFHPTEKAFVIRECATFSSDGRLDKVTMLMLSSLERYGDEPSTGD